MGRYFSDYLPGYLRVSFSHDDHDWLRMTLQVFGDARVVTPCDETFVKGEPSLEQQPDSTLALRMSSVFCPFHSLRAFLEAICVGVQECAFAWDAEGPDGALRWRRNNRGQGHLTVSWSQQASDLHVLLDRQQMVEAFYSSFRQFVDSPAYRPYDYEQLSEAAAYQLLLVEDSVSDLAEAVAALNSAKAQGLWYTAFLSTFGLDETPAVPITLKGILWASKGQLAPANHFPDWPADWNSLPPASRLEYVRSRMDLWNLPGPGSGNNLRALRSDLVERWLAKDRD